jgi:hypothetical protein
LKINPAAEKEKKKISLSQRIFQPRTLGGGHAADVF